MLYEYIDSLPFSLIVDFKVIKGLRELIPGYCPTIEDEYKLRIEYISRDHRSFTLFTCNYNLARFSDFDGNLITTFMSRAETQLREVIENSLYKDVSLKDVLLNDKFRGWLDEDN